MKHYLLGIISLGCEKNRVDTELFLGVVKKYNIEITNKINKADILVVNTCGFIESAKKESIDTIMDLIDYKAKGKTIIVMGCLVQRYLNELKENIPEVDYFLPISDYEHIDKLFKEITSSNECHEMDYNNRVITTLPHQAYLRVGDGCNNNCAYCAIPLIRGKYHSRNHFEILSEAMNLASMGIKEITIIAQDTCKYGTDLNDSYYLHDLLKDLSEIEEFKIIRVLYLYPDEITNDLIKVVKNTPKIASYFDIPIQHASDRLLKLMNRHGDKSVITSVINKIRKEIPDSIIRTTVITGFPSETDAEFNELVSFIKEIRFDRLGAFAYSDEENTKAFEMDNKVDSNIANTRRDEIMTIQQKISLENNHKYIGNTYPTIIDYYDDVKNCYIGRNYAYAPDEADGCIYIESSEKLTIGNIYDVLITSCSEYDLYGKNKSQA